MLQVIAILDVPRERFLAWLRERNMLIFKEDNQLSNFVPMTSDTTSPSDNAQQTPSNADEGQDGPQLNPSTQVIEDCLIDVIGDTDENDRSSAQEEQFFYGDG